MKTSARETGRTQYSMAEITSELAKETENEREKENVTLQSTIKMVGAFSIAQFLTLQRRWWRTWKTEISFQIEMFSYRY